MKSLEPHPEGTVTSPIPESTAEFVRIPSSELDANEKSLVHAKSGSLVLSPVISKFSTYEKEVPDRPVTEWQGSTLVKSESSKTSISSFDAT